MTSIHPTKRCRLEQKIKERSEPEYQEILNEDREDEEDEMPSLRVCDDDNNEELIEIPTLVVEIFLEWLTDVELLKTCRLVNNYWNGLACSALQINSIAKLDEENNLLEEFLEFLKPESSGELSLHPSPFKNVHITNNDQDERCIDDYCQLLENPNIKLTSLEISFYDIEIDKLYRLNHFLKATMMELINLTLTYIQCTCTRQVFHDVEFPALKSLYISQCYHSKCHKTADYSEPLRRALEHSRLQQLTLGPNFWQAACASSMININLSCVVELTLFYIGDEDETVWNQLPKLKLSLLKSFTFNSMMRHHREIVKDRHLEINAFLSNVASTLIKLDFCYGRPQLNPGLRFREIVFPKLKYLLLTFPDEIYECFTPARFPSLQTLHLYNSHMKQLQIPDEFKTLGTLRILDIFFVTRDDETDYVSDDTDSEEDEMVEVVPFSMLSWARKFPNVESFGASLLHRKYSLSLLDREEAYPNLKCLRHPDSNDFTAPPGTSEQEVEEYKRAGRLIEKIVHGEADFGLKDFDCANCK